MALKTDQAQGEVPKPRKKPGPVPGQNDCTKYKPEYCAQIVEWGKLGKSRAWMCAKLDIVPNTLHEWEKLYPQLTESLMRAKMHSQLWWEDAAQDNLKHPTFKDGLWRANMAARFREDWTEVKKTENLNEDGPNKAAAAAEERSRVRELLERSGRTLAALRVGTPEASEGDAELPNLHSVHRRAGGTGQPS